MLTRYPTGIGQDGIKFGLDVRRRAAPNKAENYWRAESRGYVSARATSP